MDFSVTYDAAANTVYIDPDKPYTEEVKAPAVSQTMDGSLSKNADGSINIPQDGSQYVPRAGDVIRCDDGTNYTIRSTISTWKEKAAISGSGLSPDPGTTTST